MQHSSSSSSSFLLGRSQSGAGVELEEDDVAVVHDVVAPLLAVLSCGLKKEREAD